MFCLTAACYRPCIELAKCPIRLAYEHVSRSGEMSPAVLERVFSSRSLIRLVNAVVLIAQALRSCT